MISIENFQVALKQWFDILLSLIEISNAGFVHNEFEAMNLSMIFL